jgi:hypothetical protein
MINIIFRLWYSIMNRSWKKIFFISLVISILFYGILLPPVLTDTRPDLFYGKLLFTAGNSGIEIKADRDTDGLPDQLENDIGTSNSDPDTDQDGLSDYDEVKKYLTSPLTRDSDGDGISDSDWNERREYTRTFTAVIDLRRPYSLEDMNDFYQDARLISVISDEVCRFEIVLYPNAEELINPSAYNPKNNSFTKPTFAKNFSLSMQADIRSKVSGVETDLQALQIIQEIFNTAKYTELNKDLGYSTDLPLQFQYCMNDQGKIEPYWLGYPAKYSMDELLDHLFFADGMYHNSSRGACPSSATLRGALLRAAGLEEQTIFTIPLFYSLESDGTVYDVEDFYGRNYSMQRDDSYTVADHFFNIVKIGSRWIRVDTNIIDPGLHGPYVKLLCTDDPAYENWKYWNYQTYSKQRPYKYVSVTENQPVHEK